MNRAATAAIFAICMTGGALAQQPPCYINERGFAIDVRDGTEYGDISNPWYGIENRDCWDAAAKSAGSSWDQLLCSGLSPDDARFKDVRKTCEALSRPLKQDFECELKDQAGNPIKTRCDEFYAAKGLSGEGYTRINREEMLDRAFSNKEVATVFEETSSAQKRRMEANKFSQEMNTQDQGNASGDAERARKFVQRHFALWQKYRTPFPNYIENMTRENEGIQKPLADRKSYSEDLSCIGCDFSGMDLRKASLGFQINFSLGNLSGAKFERSWIDLLYAKDSNFSDVKLYRAHIGKLSLVNSDITNLDLSNTYFPDVYIGYGRVLAGDATSQLTKGVNMQKATFGQLQLETADAPVWNDEEKYRPTRADCALANTFGVKELLSHSTATKIKTLTLRNIDATNVDFSPITIGTLSFLDTQFAGSSMKDMSLNLYGRFSSTSDCAGRKIFNAFDGVDLSGATLNWPNFNSELLAGRFGDPKFCGTNVNEGTPSVPKMKMVKGGC